MLPDEDEASCVLLFLEVLYEDPGDPIQAEDHKDLVKWTKINRLGDKYLAPTATKKAYNMIKKIVKMSPTIPDIVMSSHILYCTTLSVSDDLRTLYQALIVRNRQGLAEDEDFRALIERSYELTKDFMLFMLDRKRCMF